MSARRIEGKPVAAALRADTSRRAESFRSLVGRPPSLAVLLVGDDAASHVYARSKGRSAEACGIAFVLRALPSGRGTAGVVDEIRRLCDDPDTDALLVELPLPAGVDTAVAMSAIDPRRDADGVTPDSLGRLVLGYPGPRPATALAAMAMLADAEVRLEGARAVVVGRSATVGKPVALMLLQQHATVAIAHTRTRELAQLTRQADVLVVAAGVPSLIRTEHVRPGAVVVDVGTNVVTGEHGERVVGDVDQGVVEVAAAVTPVPGGVGPVTTAMVLRTVLDLAERRAAVPTA